MMLLVTRELARSQRIARRRACQFAQRRPQQIGLRTAPTASCLSHMAIAGSASAASTTCCGVRWPALSNETTEMGRSSVLARLPDEAAPTKGSPLRTEPWFTSYGLLGLTQNGLVPVLMPLAAPHGGAAGLTYAAFSLLGVFAPFLGSWADRTGRHRDLLV